MFYVIPKAIDPDLCEEIVSSSKKNILETALVTGSKGGRDDPDIRKTEINFVKEDNKVNEIVWHFLKEANKTQFNYDLEYFQQVQFAEYKDGGHYKWHQDTTPMEGNKTRKLSLTLALSNPDNYEGGELQFYNGDKPLEDAGQITAEQVKRDVKAQGSIIIFDSRDFHRVTPVVKGVRHSIVCWAVGKNFK